MEIALSIEGPGPAIQEIVELSDPGVQMGTRQPAASAADVLDAPIGVGEIREFLEVVSLVITTAGGLAALAGQLRALFGRVPEEESEASEKTTPKLRILDPRTGKEIGVVASPADIDRLVGAMGV